MRSESRIKGGVSQKNRYGLFCLQELLKCSKSSAVEFQNTFIWKATPPKEKIGLCKIIGMGFYRHELFKKMRKASFWPKTSAFGKTNPAAWWGELRIRKGRVMQNNRYAVIPIWTLERLGKERPLNLKAQSYLKRTLPSEKRILPYGRQTPPEERQEHAKE
jgi:hypothetical protein